MLGIIRKIRTSLYDVTPILLSDRCEISKTVASVGAVSDAQDGAPDLSAFIDELRATAELIARDLHGRLLVEVPAYQRLPPDQLVPELSANIALVLAPVASDFADLRPGRVTGAERARQGIDLADLLRGWRIGLEVTFEHAAALATSQACDNSVLVAFTRTMLQRADMAASAVTQAHRDAELASAVASARWRDRVLRAVLLRDSDVPDALGELAALGIGQDVSTFALCARHESDWAVTQLSMWLGIHSESRSAKALITVVGDHVIGAALQLPDTAPPQLVGVGPSGPASTLPESLHVARRVLQAAHMLGREGVCRTTDLGVLLPVVDDVEVGRTLVARYVEPFTSGAAGHDLLDTVGNYLDHRQSIDRTAAALFVHANTVRYRLQRFEQVTGADLRDPLSLAEVFWALRRHRIRGAD